ncbi:MAG: hypothetical protein FWD33_00720 [Alphaproteobacteria bacterium]|nr:hypothetical protein [Alphaproteobacteria bacterium]
MSGDINKRLKGLMAGADKISAERRKNSAKWRRDNDAKIQQERAEKRKKEKDRELVRMEMKGHEDRINASMDEWYAKNRSGKILDAYGNTTPFDALKEYSVQVSLSDDLLKSYHRDETVKFDCATYACAYNGFPIFYDGQMDLFRKLARQFKDDHGVWLESIWVRLIKLDCKVEDWTYLPNDYFPKFDNYGKVALLFKFGSMGDSTNSPWLYTGYTQNIQHGHIQGISEALTAIYTTFELGHRVMAVFRGMNK